jgi:hypothetical protein
VKLISAKISALQEHVRVLNGGCGEADGALPCHSRVAFSVKLGDLLRSFFYDGTDRQTNYA